jgi:hypothetical protein
MYHITILKPDAYIRTIEGANVLQKSCCMCITQFMLEFWLVEHGENHQIVISGNQGTCVFDRYCFSWSQLPDIGERSVVL